MFFSHNRYQTQEMFLFMGTATGWIIFGPVCAIVVYEALKYFEIPYGYFVWAAYWTGWFGPGVIATISILLQMLAERRQQG